MRVPRAVGDVPPVELADGVVAAKAWLLALVAAAPLQSVPGLPAADIARDAPELCAAILRAVGSEAELRRLEPGGDLAELAARAGRLAGAAAPAAAAAAVGHLRRALWDSLSPTSGDLDGPHVSALAARLAHVCDQVTQAALAGPSRAEGPLAGALRAAGESPRNDDSVAARTNGSGARCAKADAPADDAPAPPTIRALWAVPAEAPRDVSAEGRGGVPATGPRDVPAEGPGGVPAKGPRDVSAEGPRSGPAEAQSVEPATEPFADDGAVVALRASCRPVLPWIEAVERRIERHAEDGLPFTVLVLEADDADRLLAVDHDGEAVRALARAERAVRSAVRGDDAVVREHPGRLWIMAEAVSLPDARVLGERMADAVTGAGLLHGAPLTVSIGFAAFPDDGEDAETLAAHADEGVFAARAAGVRLA